MSSKVTIIALDADGKPYPTKGKKKAASEEE
jgi:hypothetical protein